MMLHAEMWDNYLAWVRSVQEPWTDDSDEYRERRAVEYFNHSMQCSRDLLRLKPTLQSWVPHISRGGSRKNRLFENAISTKFDYTT